MRKNSILCRKNRKVVIVTYDELEDAVKDSQLLANWDLTFDEALQKAANDGPIAIRDAFIKAYATLLAGPVAAAVALTFLQIYDVIMDYLTYKKLKPQLERMEKNHMEKIRVTVITYEWTSGSGNSTSYITDFIFA